MTHPDIAMALAAAHREDLLRAARGRGRVVVVRRSARRVRVAAWLEGQLRRRRAAATVPARCAAVTR